MTWCYEGGPGHEGLCGIVVGALNGRNFVGAIDIHEGFVTAAANITLTLNAEDNRLDGRWVSTTNRG